jgi:tRNA(Ile)-lysidine synthase
MRFLDTIRQTLRSQALLTGGETVIIGLSGGPDSMALLEALWLLRNELQLTLVPAHLNHGLRGEEAEGDLAFCQAQAEQRGLTLVSERVDLRVPLREEGRSLQETAREVRYDFLLATARKAGSDKIAVGHHADDQAETFLMRLLRGAGTLGLAAIPFTRPPGIIRPLLRVTRRQILDFLVERSVPYREDSSNVKEVYLRNRVRRDLLPVLIEKYNPNLVEDLCQTAEILREEEDLLEALTRDNFYPHEEENGVVLLLKDLIPLHPALLRRVIRRAVGVLEGSPSGISFRHVEAVRKLMSAPGSASRLSLPKGIVVGKVYDRLEFHRKEVEPVACEDHPIPIPGRDRIPTLGIEVTAKILSSDESVPLSGPNAAVFDLEKLIPPLKVRTRRPGDRFQPAGFGRSKKVKRFLIDEKIPYPVRGRLPLFVNGDGEIVWVGGVRADARFTAEPGASRRLYLQIDALNGRSHEYRR